MYEEGFRWWSMGYAAAIAFVLFVIMLVGTLVQLRLQRRGAGVMSRRPCRCSLLHVALAAGGAAHARAAAVDGVGLVHAGRRGEHAVPPPLLPQPADARALPRAVHAPRPGAARAPTARSSPRATTLALAAAQLDGRLRVRQAALRAAAIASSGCCSPRWSIPAQVGDAAAVPAAQADGARQHATAGVIVPGWRASSASSWSASTRSSIPDELLDAARVDGAGEFRIFWSHRAARAAARSW